MFALRKMRFRNSISSRPVNALGIWTGPSIAVSYKPLHIKLYQMEYGGVRRRIKIGVLFVIKSNQNNILFITKFLEINSRTWEEQIMQK